MWTIYLTYPAQNSLMFMIPTIVLGHQLPTLMDTPKTWLSSRTASPLGCLTPILDHILWTSWLSLNVPVSWFFPFFLLLRTCIKTYFYPTQIPLDPLSNHLHFNHFSPLFKVFINLGVNVVAHRFSLVVVSRGHSLLWCMSLSLPWLLLLQSTGSRDVGFSSCSTQAQ